MMATILRTTKMEEIAILLMVGYLIERNRAQRWACVLVAAKGCPQRGR
jgi:hypothetical protein